MNCRRRRSEDRVAFDDHVIGDVRVDPGDGVGEVFNGVAHHAIAVSGHLDPILGAHRREPGPIDCEPLYSDVVAPRLDIDSDRRLAVAGVDDHGTGGSRRVGLEGDGVGCCTRCHEVPTEDEPGVGSRSNGNRVSGPDQVGGALDRFPGMSRVAVGNVGTAGGDEVGGRYRPIFQ